MAGGTSKRQTAASELKWQNFQARKSLAVGRKPLPAPTTIQNVFVMLVMHVCRKIVLFQPELKICIYLAALVMGSLVCDFAPMPKSYFSRKSNFFNHYFVKLGWGWTLLSVSVYLSLTATIYCCGSIEKVKAHFCRLGIGTLMWFCWTKFFVFLENYTASCMTPKYTTKAACLQGNSYWRGFDISGHAFLLIYCSLLIAEEAKSICGWERIGELIRNQEFEEESPLKNLSERELTHLRENYDLFTPYIRAAFMWLTLLALLWDVMLVATIMYFHSMVQKVIGGSIAILVWYATYKWWYKHPSSPGLPGEGCFKYNEVKPVEKKCCNHVFSK